MIVPARLVKLQSPNIQSPANMPQPTDQQWLTRIRAGDASAMGELLAAYQGRLFNVCLRMLSNRDDAAEAAQEAMLKIVEHIGSFRGKSQLSTWMIRIAM